MKKLGFLMAVLMLVLSLPVLAGEYGDFLADASSNDYVVKAPAMLMRGVTNVVVSPVEVFVHTYKGTLEGRPIVGTLEGLGTGVIWTLDRAGRGAWDILTCLAPKYNGAPPTHELWK